MHFKVNMAKADQLKKIANGNIAVLEIIAILKGLASPKNSDEFKFAMLLRAAELLRYHAPMLETGNDISDYLLIDNPY